MEEEYEEKKKHLKERYQTRKRKYEERYKAEAESPTPVEEKVEEEVKEEIAPEVPVEERIEEEVEEEIAPEVQAPVPAAAAPVEEEEVAESALTGIEGIGSTRAKKLESEGIETLEDLAGATAVEIAKIAGVSILMASGWIRKAEEIT